MHANAELDGTDGVVPALDVAPEGTARAAVVLIQEAFGVKDHIADVANRLGDAGYRVVAPCLYHRDGVNALPYEFSAAKPHMAKLTDKGIRIDIEAALQHLRSVGFPLASTGIVGFCMGGSIALAAAVDHAFGAAVTFYGGGVVEGRFGFRPLAELAPGLLAPWLGLFGDQDPSIPPDHVELLRTEAAKASVPTSIVRYPDAGHAFHCDPRPDTYHEPSARDGWVRTLDWLGRYLQPAQ